MAASVNKVILVGNLGKDPETRYAPSGDAICNITLATTDTWRDKGSGEKREATEWHRVIFFGKLAEIANQYLKKGSSIYVEGSLRTRKWQDKDGQDRYTTEIRGDEMKMLSTRQGGQGQGGDDYGNQQGDGYGGGNGGGNQGGGNRNGAPQGGNGGGGNQGGGNRNGAPQGGNNGGGNRNGAPQGGNNGGGNQGGGNRNGAPQGGNNGGGNQGGGNRNGAPQGGNNGGYNGGNGNGVPQGGNDGGYGGGFGGGVDDEIPFAAYAKGIEYCI